MKAIYDVCSGIVVIALGGLLVTGLGLLVWGAALYVLGYTMWAPFRKSPSADVHKK